VIKVHLPSDGGSLTLQESSDPTQSARLSGSVWSDQRDGFSMADGERYVADAEHVVVVQDGELFYAE
jgi:hypothetical protein